MTAVQGSNIAIIADAIRKKFGDDALPFTKRQLDEADTASRRQWEAILTLLSA